MIRRLVPFLSVLAVPAAAEVPNVVADIGPVHSMVARVMEGVAEPSLLLPTNVTPHGHSMRPSEARMLADAEIIFWVSGDLTPWLERGIGSLAEDAVSVELLEDAGVALSPEGAKDHDDHNEEHAHGADTHDDDHGDAHDEHHGDEPHHDEEHEDAADGHDHHGHDHGDVDPHAWLDPQTGKIWLTHIAEVLSRHDPDNAVIYRANAEAGHAELDRIQADVQTRLAPVRDVGFVTLHDAYSAFERRFDVSVLGSITVSEAAPATAAQISELREEVVASRAICVFSEPQFPDDLVQTLTEGTEARSGVLDPLGAALTPGATLYPLLLDRISLSLEECLGG
ncbi:zinc ABC transporter substrate-binding protein [Jannaschia marina]|uniref:zinc ABC transporter substrate-binding protein n=1 Tax=Jannaschia marina TaxID=2741674 RepID=UPI0015C7F1C8|nr:zinc ABC transporter substrate-binding protein [Jannaschia marina]